jgi:hypothetical protein
VQEKGKARSTGPADERLEFVARIIGNAWNVQNEHTEALEGRSRLFLFDPRLPGKGSGLQAGGGDARYPAGLRSGVQSHKEVYRHAGHGALNRTAAAIRPCDKPDDYWAWFGTTYREIVRVTKPAGSSACGPCCMADSNQLDERSRFVGSNGNGPV